MKILTIEKEVDDILHTIYDAALKWAGMQIQGVITSTLKSVESDEENKKHLEINPDVDRNLHSICDAALKHSGMQVHGLIQQLISLVENKEEFSA